EPAQPHHFPASGTFHLPSGRLWISKFLRQADGSFKEDKEHILCGVKGFGASGQHDAPSALSDRLRRARGSEKAHFRRKLTGETGKSDPRKGGVGTRWRAVRGEM